MGTLKEVVKKTPVISFIYKVLRNSERGLRRKFNPLKNKSTENIFTEIYKENSWGGKDSVSGPGSDARQTKTVITALQTVLSNYKISSMLDIPCGDFHWMKNVDLNKINYTGADIVQELIEENKVKYSTDGLQFQHINLTKDKLPKVDLIFCRDCLVHLSFTDILLALNNVCDSRSGYFLTTTFTERDGNHDILTGHWHPINLELPPFALPKPLKIINEGCTEGGGVYTDKALGLWSIDDIRECLARRCSR